MHATTKNKLTKLILSISMLISSVSQLSAVSFGHKDSDTYFALSGSFKPEIFYGRNIHLLNNNNHWDRVFYARHTLDIKFDASYGREAYGHDIIYTRFAPRNRTIWGDPKGYFKTTGNTIKSLETVYGPHRHYNPRNFFWIREIWIELDLNDVLNWYTLSRHTFTLGAFSFELGRGISLGDAYAVGPELLGFYTDGAVDQYAFAAKLSGDIVENRLTYDLYSALLKNKASNLGDTAERILGQQYNCRKNPERGFGKMNFLVAGRLNWTAVNIADCARVNIEPYWLYNRQPEQRIEFIGDAYTHFGTIGIACECEGKCFDAGLECALNLGHQYVNGWDRNKTSLYNRDGFQTIINSQVIYENLKDKNDPLNGKKFPYVPGSTSQDLIENSIQDESQNGKTIGTATYVGQEVSLLNSSRRFKNPYTNRFNGCMFVADAAWWNSAKDLNVSAAFGYASGDSNPNEVEKDGVYGGFVPLQSYYSGMSKRVRSAFVLGGFGRLQRSLPFPLSQPAQRGQYSRAINGFTNLLYTGCALYWNPNRLDGKVKLHPNVMLYWQDLPVKGYDANTATTTKDCASKFLGTEFSLFFDYYLKPPLKLFFVSAIFIPGTHFYDILGKPITALQARAITERIERLDNQDVTGYLDERIPNIGKNTAFSFNLGIEYKF